ncbi:hypothetical protein [Saccharopolyspora spinosa]|uniref:hypothetical protein n=1 Tax=Saccharopolyspora spinosa TaxID=60894 RepID=UPI00376EC430
MARDRRAGRTRLDRVLARGWLRLLGCGERTGTYRIGGDVALFDENGKSEISGADFALAVVDEIERHEHPREHISVAY